METGMDGMPGKRQTLQKRLRKLLQMTVDNGCSEQEAITAAMKAQEMIAKYHLVIAEEPEEEEISHNAVPAARKWAQSLAHAVARCMCCSTISIVQRGGTVVEFWGRATDQIAAIETYRMLELICRVGIRREKRMAKLQRNSSIRGIESAYAMGFLQAVNDELGKNCQALMLVIPPAAREAMDAAYPRQAKVRPHLERTAGQLGARAMRRLQQAGYVDAAEALRRRWIGRASEKGQKLLE